jgi:hypothetical protein
MSSKLTKKEITANVMDVARKDKLSEEEAVRMLNSALRKAGFSVNKGTNKKGFTESEEYFIGDDASSSKKERIIKESNKRDKQLKEMRMEQAKELLAEEAAATEKNRTKNIELMQQLTKKKLGMKYGGMANGKKHMYAAGGSVTENPGMKALKKASPQAYNKIMGK